MSNPSWQPNLATTNPYAAPKIQKQVGPTQLENELAGRGERLVAVIIDGLVYLPGVLIVGFTTPSEPVADDAPIIGGLIGAFLVLAILVVQIVLLVNKSATLGKLALRIYIADYETGQPAGWVKTVLVRMFLNGLLGAVPCFGSLYGLVDTLFIFRSDRRCIHDLLAKTVVVKRN
jgi:uncharacterized RDD family membrane protein YckC